MQRNTVDKVCLISFGKTYGDNIPAKASAEIISKYFENVKIVVFNPDETDTHDPKKEKARKLGVRKLLDSLEYDYLISFWGFLFLREKDFKKACKGAINFHPCPPEHPGLACYVYPLLFPEKRNFHGVTCHEIDVKLDHGKIYATERFDIGNRTGPELLAHNFQLGLNMLDEVCSVLHSGCNTTALQRDHCLDEVWSSTYFSGKYEKEIISTLPKGNPIREMNLFDGNLIYNYCNRTDILEEDYEFIYEEV